MSETISIYNKNAGHFSDTYEGTRPTRIHDLIRAFFYLGRKTLDVGCGSGRDVSFLCKNQFNAEGVDASQGMIAEAKRRHPECVFSLSSLPELKEIGSETFDNLLANAVLMHLPEAEIVKGLMAMLRVLKNNGRAIISFRGPSNHAEDRGRRFTYLSGSQVAELLESLGATVLLVDQNVSDEKHWHTVVAEKKSVQKQDGIARIQNVITNDSKTATYKLALLRSLCDLARSECHTVVWNPELDFVIVPLERLALSWLRYYWAPIRENVRQTTSNDLAFSSEVRELMKPGSGFANPRDVILNYESAKPNPIAVAAIKKIAATINNQPVRYAKGGDTPLFGDRNSYTIHLDENSWKLQWFQLKGIKVPAAIWRDIRLFHHWIEKSLIVEWIELTTDRLDRRANAAQVFDMLYNVDYEDNRSTSHARKLLSGQKLFCVWSGKKLNSKTFHVDHAIPYALWRNNDWWNLLPASPEVNSEKKMLLPHPDEINRAADRIMEYWEIYRNEFGSQFDRQMLRSLGCLPTDSVLQSAIDQLVLTTTQLHHSRGIPYFMRRPA